MIVFKRRLIRGEAWFDESYDTNGLDIVELHMCSNPPTGATVKPKPTLMVDLGKDENVLFNNLRDNTKYLIRRALERDDLNFRTIDPITDEVIDEFCEFHNQTTANNPGGKVQRALSGLEILEPLDILPCREAGVLHISEVSLPTGERVSFHASYRNQGYSCPLHSALRRKGIPGLTSAIAGRANRAHYWLDMLLFKKAGDHHYDLGGWYHGFADKGKIPIADFKAEFGGHIHRSSHSEIGVSLKGKAYLLFKRVVGRVLGRNVTVMKKTS